MAHSAAYIVGMLFFSKSRLYRLLLLVTFISIFLHSSSVSSEPQYIIHSNDSLLLATIDSTFNAVTDDLANLLHDTLNYRPHIFVEDNLSAFEKRIGEHFPDWGAAAAMPERRMIVIKSPRAFSLNRSLGELLGHELSHLLLYQRLGSIDAPRWFDEGMAMQVSSEWNWSDNLNMSRAAVFGQLMSLREIENVNRFGESSARLAYSESYLAVGFFYENYGTEAVNLFLDSLAAGTSLDSVLLLSTGSNYSDFNGEFQLYLHKKFTLLTLLSDTMYFWLALAFILILGAVLKYRRRQDYYDKWEKEEELHSTDFDYGDSDNPEETEDDEPWRS